MPFGTGLQPAHDPYVSIQPFIGDRGETRTLTGGKALTVFKTASRRPTWITLSLLVPALIYRLSWASLPKLKVGERPLASEVVVRIRTLHIVPL